MARRTERIDGPDDREQDVTERPDEPDHQERPDQVVLGPAVAQLPQHDHDSGEGELHVDGLQHEVAERSARLHDLSDPP